MTKIKITADSTCDLTDKILTDINVDLIPLYINKDGISYKDRFEITPMDIFDYFEKQKKLTTTSAPSINDYITVFKKYVENDFKVIHISLSKDISASHQNAVLASKEFNKGEVFVIDSRSLSTGSGFVVLKCAELINKGMEPEKIYAYLNNEYINKIDVSFIVDTLTYLHKGGRCSSVAKLGANLLKLKPCIELKDGKMHVGKKYRGSFNKCLLEYIDDKLKDRNDIDKEAICITFSTCPENALESVKKQIVEVYKFKNVILANTGCTISNHCGPNTLGIIFVKK